MAVRSRPDPTASVLELVCRHPGLRAYDLARKLDVHPTTAAYHLRKLEREDLLIREGVGRKVQYYPRGLGWCRGARRVHARLTPAARFALERALEGRPVARRTVEAHGHSRSAARYALQCLVEAGALRREARGVYVLARSLEACARAALGGRPCQGCAAPADPRTFTSGRPRGDRRRAGGSPPPARDGRRRR